MVSFFVLLLLPLLVSRGYAFQFSIDLPDDVKSELDSCIQQSKDTPIIHWQGELACLHDYFAKLKPNNITEEDWNVFKRASDDGFGHHPPPTGPSFRREIRTLSKDEWKNVTDVFRQLFNAGTLQSFGRLHGLATSRAHKGAAFLPWHRIFVTHFEQEMRNINPSVSLPYWDYTIDFDIAQPFESVLWTPCFFGENNDVVRTGPFNFLYGAHGAIISRDLAKTAFSTRLINKKDMEVLRGFCNFKDITTGLEATDESHNLESLHDSVHDYIGGDMGVVENSAYDPIFWFHHAFIDYIWEYFREHQIEKCSSIDLESDYRPLNDLGWNISVKQGPHDPVFGYGHLRNIDGLWLNWTNTFYSYEPQPACSTTCKGDYLFCDDKDRCLSRTRETCTELFADIWHGPLERSSLEPKLPCETGTDLKGLKGDGRTIETSAADCENILKRDRGEIDPHHADSNDNGSSGYKTATGLLATIVALAVVAVVIYSAHRRKWCKPYDSF